MGTIRPSRIEPKRYPRPFRARDATVTLDPKPSCRSLPLFRSDEHPVCLIGRRTANAVRESAMPSHLVGRIAVVIGLAAVVFFLILTLVPPPVQVLVALLSLPLGASLVAGASAAPRRRAR
jgi:hypothetical protein